MKARKLAGDHLVALLLICGAVILEFALYKGTANAATINAKTPLYTDVAAAVSEASYGDTVVVPAGTGSVTWNSTLTITKGIHLQGPGRNALTIRIGSIGQYKTLIELKPDATSISFGHVFAVSGFKIYGATDTYGIALNHTGTNGFGVAKICDNEFEGFGGESSFPINYHGHWKGVVYNNVFLFNSKHSYRYSARNATTWNWLGWYEYGTADVLFFEDNTFQGLSFTASSGGHGSRVVIRYNSFQQAESLWPLIDGHGNQGSGVAGMMGMEIYRNTLSGKGSGRIDLRGGRSSFWGNTASGAAYSPRVRNDNCNDAEGTAKRDAATQTFEIQNSYHFLNYNGNTLTHTSLYEAGCYEEIPENKNFWNQNESFNPGVSTSLLNGIGVGTRAQMNMVKTCAAGVGYWVIDEGDWDSTNPGYDGRLYRCTKNAWEVYYTPYPYPHPLRGKSGSSGAAVPSVPQTPKGVTVIW